jgi:hypothetical protein
MIDKKIIIPAVIFILLRAGISASEDPFVQYLAGIEMLRAAIGMPVEEKTSCYRRLCEITGFSAALAREKLESISDAPEKWVDIYAGIMIALDSADAYSVQKKNMEKNKAGVTDIENQPSNKKFRTSRRKSIETEHK